MNIPIQFTLVFEYKSAIKLTMIKRKSTFRSTHRHHFHAGCTLAI